MNEAQNTDSSTRDNDTFDPVVFFATAAEDARKAGMETLPYLQARLEELHGSMSDLDNRVAEGDRMASHGASLLASRHARMEASKREYREGLEDDATKK